TERAEPFGFYRDITHGAAPQSSSTSVSSTSRCSNVRSSAPTAQVHPTARPLRLRPNIADDTDTARPLSHARSKTGTCCNLEQVLYPLSHEGRSDRRSRVPWHEFAPPARRSRTRDHGD